MNDFTIITVSEYFEYKHRVFIVWLILQFEAEHTGRRAQSAATYAAMVAKENEMRGSTNRYSDLAGIAIVAGLLSGCSTDTPTFGDQLASQGTATTELGERWNQGDELIKEGQELVSEGQSDVSRGENNISEGQSKIARGQQMRRNAEETYGQQFPGQPVPVGN